jgi:hypothetical protein
MTPKSTDLHLRRKLLIGIGILVICCLSAPLVGTTFWLRGDVQEGKATQAAYNTKLIQIGIEPSIAGVEAYIRRTVQPGEDFAAVSKKLGLIGLVTRGSSISRLNVKGCSNVTIWLVQKPGTSSSSFSFTEPPIYQIDICEAGGSINWVGELVRVDNR